MEEQTKLVERIVKIESAVESTQATASRIERSIGEFKSDVGKVFEKTHETDIAIRDLKSEINMHELRLNVVERERNEIEKELLDFKSKLWKIGGTIAAIASASGVGAGKVLQYLQ